MHLFKIEQAVLNALLPFAMYMMIRSVHAKRYLYKQYCIHVIFSLIVTSIHVVNAFLFNYVCTNTLLTVINMTIR